MRHLIGFAYVNVGIVLVWESMSENVARLVSTWWEDAHILESLNKLRRVCITSESAHLFRLNTFAGFV